MIRCKILHVDGHHLKLNCDGEEMVIHRSEYEWFIFNRNLLVTTHGALTIVDGVDDDFADWLDLELD